jgi:HamA
MRSTLKELIEKIILFKYELPNDELSISKSKISTENDSCYSAESNDELANIIYNAVIEYAFNEYDITEYDFDILHRRALTRKLKFNDQSTDEQKLRYGFYGEVILYCMLYIFYKAPPIIARGHLYQILENGETKGYDAYHLIDNQGQSELWFGEVKFYASFKAATTGKNGAITNLKKAISDKYLNTNLIAISERTSDLAIDGTAIKPILDDLKQNPDIKISELSKKYSIKLVYPILILFDGKSGEYDKTIEEAIKHIEESVGKIKFDISIDVSLFFILFPVESSKNIKLKVLEWIRDKKQLMS